MIDSFSSDETITLAKKHDVKIVQRVFDDFSTQKNVAIDMATHDWIYILDADERVTDALRNEILNFDFKNNDNVGFYVKRNFYFLGKKIKYSGWQRDKVVRLFDRKFCKYNGVPVHELIEAKGKLGYFKGTVDHFSYRDFDHYISKLNQYATLQAQNLHQENKKVTAYHLFVKPPVRFVIHYIIRLGFLDGFAGFLIAKTQAYAVLTRYIKLWLLNNKKK